MSKMKSDMRRRARNAEIAIAAHALTNHLGLPAGTPEAGAIAAGLNGLGASLPAAQRYSTSIVNRDGKWVFGAPHSINKGTPKVGMRYHFRQLRRELGARKARETMVAGLEAYRAAQMHGAVLDQTGQGRRAGGTA